MTSKPTTPQATPLTLEEAYKKLGELLQTQSPYTKTNLLEIHLQTNQLRTVKAEILGVAPTERMLLLTRELNRLVQEASLLADDLTNLESDMRKEISS